jgi:hypothetical protein
MDDDMASTPSERTGAATVESTVLSREQLYELVWSEPVAHVAERYGLSGPGLRKLCLRQGVPVPPWVFRRKAATDSERFRPPFPSVIGH